MPIADNDTATVDKGPTLPPALYWSPSLADHLNLQFDEHTLHGLIDATGSILMAWADVGWEVLPGLLPADALRLVCEVAL